MPLFDMPLEQLQTYAPPRYEPAGFDRFWQTTLQAARQYPLNATFVPVDYKLATIQNYDVAFSGYGGQRIKGWFSVPANHEEQLPCVVEFIGYGGGRAFPTDWLLWPSAGYAYLVMDTRGQGSAWSPGDTPDPEVDGSNAHFPGFFTRGIASKDTYYYRRLITDAIRAVETAQSHPVVDRERIVVTGISQGGGVALAVTGLLGANINVLMADVPGLCHFRRATTLTTAHPYLEIVHYLAVHRDQVETVFSTLDYFDGLNFAARAKARALFSVGLMDEVCPPSTIYAAFNTYGGPKEIRTYPFNGHEGGGTFHTLEKLNFLSKLMQLSQD